MKCDEARAGYLAGNSSRAHLDHLGSCASCRSLADRLESTRALLDDAVWHEPDPRLEDRVVTLIAGDRGKRIGSLRTRSRWLAVAAVAVAFAVSAALLLSTRSEAADWEVALPGTPSAADATGIVQGWNENSGTRVRFDIENLPDAPPGNVYEVWFSRGAVHISAGTFAAAGEIEMWTGISRRDFPRIWITLEPLDSDESPSGRVVMDTG